MKMSGLLCVSAKQASSRTAKGLVHFTHDVLLVAPHAGDGSGRQGRAASIHGAHCKGGTACGVLSTLHRRSKLAARVRAWAGGFHPILPTQIRVCTTVAEPGPWLLPRPLCLFIAEQ